MKEESWTPRRGESIFVRRTFPGMSTGWLPYVFHSFSRLGKPMVYTHRGLEEFDEMISWSEGLSKGHLKPPYSWPPETPSQYL